MPERDEKEKRRSRRKKRGDKTDAVEEVADGCAFFFFPDDLLDSLGCLFAIPRKLFGWIGDLFTPDTDAEGCGCGCLFAIPMAILDAIRGLFD